MWWISPEESVGRELKEVGDFCIPVGYRSCGTLWMHEDCLMGSHFRLDN